MLNDDEIRKLRAEAEVAGDAPTVRLCDDALNPNAPQGARDDARRALGIGLLSTVDFSAFPYLSSKHN